MIVISSQSSGVLRSCTALLTAVAAVATTCLLTGCGAGPAPAAADGKMTVVAAFYPLQFATEQVGGDRVTVTNLVKPGAEPHDLELQPSQMADLERADLVVYLRGMQPAVDAAVDQNATKSALDTSTVTPLRDAPAGSEDLGRDPHIWLDPTRLAAVADTIANRLAALDPAHSAAIRARAAALRTRLEALDREYATGLAHCQRHEIVTSHAAFGYLATRYNLTQVPITGLAPDEEATPRHLSEAASLARRYHATTIFFESLVSPKIAETVAREIGAKAEVLDPVEGIEPGSSDDYFSVMHANLTTLRTALDCS
ncbi:zinc ABC transporter substrate-binding protein [Planosporangium thailandense]|uniref:Zinc ABC transporter substrate-binding protein n=1 Tax=Planosporangium thailandense TaxID=765197 RepID=A0ABX0Y0S3_9ACTN|nr:metal ABC transporter substrate-binding protein [Planosporangium thailandense]NJC71067.1 zinc ABC transporter substrate-binding protein [Planosporangium thailandense]